MTRGTVVIAGALAQKPRHGGHAWVLLQYLLGFRHLGWDVLFLDRLAQDAVGVPPAFLNIMRDFELEGHYALLRDESSETIGLTREQVLDRVRTSALLLNVMGFISDEDVLSRATKRVFFDIDPGFPQMWNVLGLHDAFAGHNAFVTIAPNIGQPGCGIPSCGLDWLTIVQPVVMERWPVRVCNAPPRFTSVATWRGSNGPIDYLGTRYGLRVHEFRQFMSLPCLTRRQFELALDIHPSEVNDLDLLRSNGWCLTDPLEVACDPHSYQTYIQRSGAEFMVAKHMYVATNSGWFSDRSICYLASGKPVLAQDTGFGGLLPAGKGLVTFSTLEEARAGAEAITEDYPAHCRSARLLAQEFFDSDAVLTRLLSRLGVA